jgi:hypothetical protein
MCAFTQILVGFKRALPERQGRDRNLSKVA